MKLTNWLIINKNGIKSIRKNKPYLAGGEIAIKINLDIPQKLFEKPQLEANIKIENIFNTDNKVDLILNTKELIEQQTGAKIDFRILESENN